MTDSFEPRIGFVSVVRALPAGKTEAFCASRWPSSPRPSPFNTNRLCCACRDVLLLCPGVLVIVADGLNLSTRLDHSRHAVDLVNPAKSLSGLQGQSSRRLQGPGAANKGRLLGFGGWQGRHWSVTTGEPMRGGFSRPKTPVRHRLSVSRPDP